MNKHFLTLALGLSTLALHAQDFGIESTFKKLSGELVRTFPYVALIGLIGVGIYNAGHFIGENSDSSKGIKNIIKYLIFILIVVGIYQFVKTIKL